MSAKNGWMRSFGLLGCLAAVAMLGSALLASAASAMKSPPTPTAYIALGDSLSFGYKAKTFNANQVAHKANCEAALVAAGKGEFSVAKAENALCEPPSSFEGGFVGYFGEHLAKTEAKGTTPHTLTTVNLGCPGETSDGLIGHVLGGEGEEFEPCAYRDAIPGGSNWPLKTEFGTSSQLEAAVNLIATKAAGEVTAVSLQIGSNDELHVIGKCKDTSYDAEHGFTSLTQCILHEVGPEGYAYEGGVFHHVLTNIGTTIGVLRAAPAKYTGKVLVIGFYNPQATLLAGSDQLQEALNGALESIIAKGEFGPGVELAQPFPVFNPESKLYKEGESAKEHTKKLRKEEQAICKLTEMCTEVKGKLTINPEGDIHPTAKGYKTIGRLMVNAF